ncbi:hypothetical protein [Nigerium massiliense]|uniref:hypothetical protein n=1 Tax=Nigerium massiliense TaxID=1522317 RepID=UPI0006944B55|nr:hypothetical protein [Nigerium massiliense]
MPNNKLILAAGAATSAVIITAGGAVLANAAGQTPDTTPVASPSASSGASSDVGGDKDGCRPRGGHSHTDATAAETAKVKEAVKAKDAAITVERVRKDADGSFDARGTKNGDRVMVEVSADYATVTVHPGERPPAHR